MHSLVTYSSFHRMVFYVALAVFFLPEAIGNFFQYSERGAKKSDRGSYAVLTLMTLGGLLAAFYSVNAVSAATIDWHQPVLFWIGIAVIFGGTGLRWYSIRVLGRYFSRDVATREGQEVVDRGPYRLVRHPSYSGAMLAFSGIGLALTNWLAIAALVITELVGYSYRVHVEEKALCAALGQPYLDYMKRTRRFIPYIW